jgi:uncharacterized membrane protein YfcA
VFLIFALVRFANFSFLMASAHAKWINMASNLGALVYFLPNGFVIWKLAILLALANMLGSYWGSHLAIKKGSHFIRLIFRGVVIVLIAKVAWDTVRSFY